MNYNITIETVEMNTNVISMIFDVSEDDNNKIGEDIFQKNTNLGSSGICEHTKVGDYCIIVLDTNDFLDCSSTIGTEETIKYCSRVVEIKDGKAIYDGEPSKFKMGGRL